MFDGDNEFLVLLCYPLVFVDKEHHDENRDGLNDDEEDVEDHRGHGTGFASCLPTQVPCLTVAILGSIRLL